MQNFLTNHYGILIGIEIAYFLFVTLLAAKIILDTQTVSKTLAYLLLIIFLPVIGILFYFLFGINYRKNRFFEFKIKLNEVIYQRIKDKLIAYHKEITSELPDAVRQSINTINFLFNATLSAISKENQVELLINGEEKFPKVLEVIAAAKHHIHLEYYIYENDSIGNQLAGLLIKKAGEGVYVRLLYDDFGSRKIGKSLLKKLRNNGVQVSPVNKIRLKIFANRMNYRDHRKIIIVDGEHVFSGGINVSDRYINPNKAIFWRDTHLYVHGNAAMYFQYLFLTNWVFATEKPIDNLQDFLHELPGIAGNKYVQVAASGPDVRPSIMLATISAIYEAKKRVYITTPYFIPVESVLNAIKSQALAGIDVRLLVPKHGDSALVNAAAYSYYANLLRNNVRIFFYEKGFLHAKTILIDDYFSSIGTANMDVRSQELNFEVNTHIYDKEINSKLYEVFLNDIKDSTEIKLEEWKNRPVLKVFFEHLARLFSPLL